MSMAMSSSSRGLQAVLRQSRQFAARTPARRFQSTNTEKATEAAKNIQSKASQGLSRVTSSAGPAISGAAKGLGNALSKIGGRTGRLIAFVERQIPPTIYYARVGLELGKLVFQGQKMAPPNVATFQSYFQQALKSLRNPSALFSSSSSANPNNVLQRIRNVNQAQLVSGGVLFAELLGFFTVGEIIGRMKLVGYRGDTHAHH